MRRLNMNQGQALVEYVLLMAMIAGFGSLLFTPMAKLLGSLEKPLREDFVYAYKLGDPKARDYGDQDGPKRHPRVSTGQNGRLFGRGPTK